jgi:predicted MFS family arabinose efflux permease
VTQTVVPATYRQVFAEPVFRALFGTRSLAIAGETLRIVALSILVYAQTGSPLLGAVAYGVGFLPQLVGGVLFGAMADRVRARRLIVLGYLAQAGVAAVLGLVHLPVWASLALVAAVASVSPLFGGVVNRLMAEALAGDAFVLGRSLMSMASSGAQLLGLAAGGVAVGLLGARHALLVTAAGHLVAAGWARLALPDRGAPAGPGGGPAPTTQGTPTAQRAATDQGAATARTSALKQSLAGTRLMATDPVVRALLLAQWLPPGFVVGAESLLVPYAADRGFAAGVPGLLLASLPVGMLVGDVVVGRFFGPGQRERLFVPLLVLLGAPLVAVAAGLPLAVLVGLLVLSGCGFAYSLTVQRRFLDAVPEDARGHAYALLSTGLMTVQGLGPVVFGAVSELTGTSAAIGLAGVATLVAAAVLARGVRRV